MANPGAVKAAMNAARDPKGFAKQLGKKLIWFLLPYLLPIFLFIAIFIAAVGINNPAQASQCDASGANVIGQLATTNVTYKDLSKDQLNIARTIYEVAGAHVNIVTAINRGAAIGIGVAMQESTLQNLKGGDRDSVGVFQQRKPWATKNGKMQSPDPRTDVALSAALFFDGGLSGQPGLNDIKGWDQMTFTVAAQTVQVSAYPTAYAKWETLATSLVKKFNDEDGSTGAGVGIANEPAPVVSLSDGSSAALGGTCAANAANITPGTETTITNDNKTTFTFTPPSLESPQGRAINAGLQCLGIMYTWNGGLNRSSDSTTDAMSTCLGQSYGLCEGGYSGLHENACHVIGFDCSGFTSYAVYQGTHHKLNIPSQTSAMYAAISVHFSDAGQLQPGDLIFYGASIHHVAMYIGKDSGGKDIMIEALETGVPVRVTNLRTTDSPRYARPNWNVDPATAAVT